MLLDGYSAKSIQEKEIEPPCMIVEGLLPIGLTTLAGSPKLGKSWLVLLLCCCVANQIPFLGRQTFQGEVLYLDLEGSPYRIQERLLSLNMGFPDYLTIVHKAPKLDEGLIDAFEEWYCTCDSIPRLIVIDTVTRIRSKSKKGMNAYDLDSDMFAPLQKFALEHEVSIIAVTHLKKETRFFGTSEDWLERITGSMGLSGISDNIWGLFRKRGEDTAFLRTSARDVDAGDFVIRFDNGVWKFVSDDLDQYQFLENPIVRFLSESDSFNCSAAELCKEYMQYCSTNNLPHGLSQGQPESSFGIQMKQLQNNLWRIGKSLSIDKKRNGTFYQISNF